MVLPDGRQLKLWKESIDRLDLAELRGEAVRESFEKYYIDSSAARAEPSPLSAIYVLHEARAPFKAGIEPLALPEALANARLSGLPSRAASQDWSQGAIVCACGRDSRPRQDVPAHPPARLRASAGIGGRAAGALGFAGQMTSPRGIVWLASFPKSGNTWFRILLANLTAGKSGPSDINNLDESGGIAGSRDEFEAATMLDSGLLSHDDIDRLRPRVYEAIAAETSEQRWIKVHDAYTSTSGGEPLLGRNVARAAVYLVRDPRDVAVSLAYHNGATVDDMIKFMNATDSAFARQPRGACASVAAEAYGLERACDELARSERRAGAYIALRRPGGGSHRVLCRRAEIRGSVCDAERNRTRGPACRFCRVAASGERERLQGPHFAHAVLPQRSCRWLARIR